MVAGSGRDLSELLAEIDACDICAAELPLGPRPVLRASRTARLMVIGQAPGTRVHETGIPWNDKSGERLRYWLDIDNETFYDAARIAIVPMGFCYPGRDQRGGDVVHAIFVAYLFDFVFPCTSFMPVVETRPGIAGNTQPAQTPHPLGHRVIVGNQHAAIASGKIFLRLKTETKDQTRLTKR